MSTKILDKTKIKALQPSLLLDELYRPEEAKYRFHAKTIATAKKWQKTTKRQLLKTLGFQTLPKVDFAPKVIETVDKGDYTREKVLLQISKYSKMPVYLLIPKEGKKPFPTVVAFHGHGYGVKDIVGLWQDGEERDIPDGYHKDFAVALCRKGFAVAAPEISCFGERQSDFSSLNTTIGQGVPSTCAHTSFLAFHLGGSTVGLRVFEGKRLVDYLETRSDMNTKRLGAMGISGGGMHTFFSTCADDRIKACVVSGYFCPFKNSILAMHHCSCNFVPGLHKFGEIYDLVGLIAPRPMLIEAGSYDPIFPMKSVIKSVAKARSVYSVFDARKAVQTDYFEGRHQISGAKAYDFLLKNV